jgi:methyl-accepting chemotaxis protein
MNETTGFILISGFWFAIFYEATQIEGIFGGVISILVIIIGGYLINSMYEKPLKEMEERLLNVCRGGIDYEADKKVMEEILPTPLARIEKSFDLAKSPDEFSKYNNEFDEFILTHRMVVIQEKLNQIKKKKKK